MPKIKDENLLITSWIKYRNNSCFKFTNNEKNRGSFREIVSDQNSNKGKISPLMKYEQKTLPLTMENLEVFNLNREGLLPSDISQKFSFNEKQRALNQDKKIKKAWSFKSSSTTYRNSFCSIL